MICPPTPVLLRCSAELGHGNNHHVIPLVLHVPVKRLKCHRYIPQKIAVLSVELTLPNVCVPATYIHPEYLGVGTLEKHRRLLKSLPIAPAGVGCIIGRGIGFLCCILQCLDG